MHAWLPLSDGWSTDTFVKAAEVAGVLLRPASVFLPVEGPAPTAVRVSLSTPDDRDSVVTGIERLAVLLERGPS
jgi:DNA-binding transcriptional MocR family regulator